MEMGARFQNAEGRVHHMFRPDLSTVAGPQPVAADQQHDCCSCPRVKVALRPPSRGRAEHVVHPAFGVLEAGAHFHLGLLEVGVQARMANEPW